MLHKYRLHWSVHPLKDDAWYKEQQKRMSPDEIARELDIEYSLSVSGRVFSSFNDRKHVTTTAYSINPQRPVYRIWDFGRTNAVLYGQLDEYGRRRVFHERVLENSSTPEQIQVVLTDTLALLPVSCELIDICDPAGNYDDGRGLATHIMLLNEHEIYPRFRRILAIPSKERKKRARTMIENDLQRCPSGDDALVLYVSDDSKMGAPVLCRAFQGGYAYRLDANGHMTDVIHEKHPFEDVMDCLFYWYLETRELPSVTESRYRIYPASRDDA